MEYEALFQTIGQKIFHYRKAAGLTQEELSERTGLTSGTISRIERGVMPVKTTTLYNIAQVLNVTCDSLIYAEPSKDSSIRNIGLILSDQSPEFIAAMEQMVRYCAANFSCKPEEEA